MSGAAVRLENVAFSYGETAMSFDLDVEASEIVAIMGPSGSGKSTLLNLVAGFEAPSSGRILIGGEDAAGLPPAQRPVSMVFQENNLFSHLDVARNVGLGRSPSLRLTGADRADIAAALARTGLAGKEKRLPAELSGGERQRVALARALLRDRPVLLLDEAFASLGTSVDSRLPAWRRLLVLATFVITIGMWLSEPLHGVPTPVVAFVPLTVFTVSGVLTSSDIRSLQWDVLLLLAGGLALGIGVSETGLADWLVSKLPTDDASPLVLAVIFAMTAMLLSNFMSNTAAANVIIPMGLALAVGSEAFVVVPIAFGASLAMCLPVSTPPNAIAYSTGQLDARDFLVGGVLIGVVGLAISIAWSQVALRWIV